MTSNLILPSGAAWTLVEVRYNDAGALQHYAFVYDGAGTLTTYTNKVGDGGIAHTPSVTDYLITDTVYNTAVTFTNLEAYTYDDTAFNQAAVDADYALYIAGGVDEPLTGSVIASGSMLFELITESALSGDVVASGSMSTTMVTESALSGSVTASGSMTTEMITESALTGSVSASGSMTTQMITESALSGSVAASGSMAMKMLTESALTGSIVATGSMVTAMILVDGVIENVFFTTVIENVPKYETAIENNPKYPTAITNTAKYIIEVTYEGKKDGAMNYDKGSLAIIRATIKKAVKFEDAVLFSPSTVAVTITDPSGVKKFTAVTMVEDSIGKWYYYLQTGKDWESGLYKVDVDIADSGDFDVTVDRTLVLE
jgi:hypothetical protein